MYVKLVDQSLRSHVEKNLHFEQFILTYQDPELDSHVHTWIELAVKLNVTVLGIHPSFLCSYSLPDVIYDAKNLTTLRLSKCNFEFDISTTHITFNCLEALCLNNVHISDNQLQRDSNVTVLSGYKQLSYFWPSTSQDNLLPHEIAILDGYNTLQTLKLTGASIMDQQFRDVSYKFPNISQLDLTSCYKLKNIEIQIEKLKKFTISDLNSLEKVTIQSPNLLEFGFYGSKMPFSYMDTSSLKRSRLNFFLPSTNFGNVDNSWYTNLNHFVQKFNYSKGLILIIFCRQANIIIIYENPREIVIPPNHKVEICIIAPMLHIESIIGPLLINRPKIMSILPCINSKALQVMSTLKGCTQMQNVGKECPFDTKWHRNLKEVISCTGTPEEGMAASMWYLWLKSTFVIDQVNNFMLKWK
ncbi:hypothetical protein H5410_062458 [Solanum commersonii]|uniref:Uncharacterized protein n=1 Tax=Solanum commersonii TaxID=4109 RepID=A0A9J5WBL8_SOLCO|nr:hypothetical protein H5410_062458 [Solanum commersonii]